MAAKLGAAERAHQFASEPADEFSVASNLRCSEFGCLFPVSCRPASAGLGIYCFPADQQAHS